MGSTSRTWRPGFSNRHRIRTYALLGPPPDIGLRIWTHRYEAEVPGLDASDLSPPHFGLTTLRGKLS
ncbi:unnamed protein product [Amoebophrya sp. A25]|nr:unnamed protein product [Amoebophrya sp. A25]